MLADNVQFTPEKETNQDIQTETKRSLLSWKSNQITEWLNKETPDTTGLCLSSGWTFPENETSMLIARGGTGKSYFLLSLLTSFATGKTYGEFRPKRPYRCLGLFGEDNENILIKRVKSIISQIKPSATDYQKLDDNLNLKSVINLRLCEFGEHNNPTATANYRLLCEALETAKEENKPIEVLVIDPLIRFFGLNENDNQHASFFIDTILGQLQRDYNLTIIVSHHISKSDSHIESVEKLEEISPRGASAFLDNCRYALAMSTMTEKDAKKYKIADEDRRNYVAIKPFKNNYTGTTAKASYFKRSVDGVLIPTSPERSLNEIIEDELLDCLNEYSNQDEISYTYEVTDRNGVIKTQTETAKLPPKPKPKLGIRELARNPENKEYIRVIQKRLTAKGLRGIQKNLAYIIGGMVQKGLIGIQKTIDGKEEILV